MSIVFSFLLTCTKQILRFNFSNMSECFNYKASFKSPKNQYLKYFCEKPASDWTFRKFKKHFKQLKQNPEALYIKQLLSIKEHSKSIPEPVLIKINDQLEKLTGAKRDSPPVFNQIITVLFDLLTMYIR